MVKETTASQETNETQNAPLDMEAVDFGIIASAGTARSMAFEALKHARVGEFEEADKLLEQSREASLEAHHVQTDLLSRCAGGEDLPVDVLLVHAQDHLMTSMLAQELITEMVEMYKKLEGAK